MLLIGRPGEFDASESMRVNVTALAGSAFAFCEMNTRPRVVAAHMTESLLGAREIQPTLPALRSEPYGYGAGQDTFAGGGVGFGHASSGPYVNPPRRVA